MIRLAAPVLLLALLASLLANCVGGAGASPASDDATVVCRRFEGGALELFAQGAVWDLPTAPAPRRRASRWLLDETSVKPALVLRENAALVLQIPGRAFGQLQLSLRGESRGAGAIVRIATLVVPIDDFRGCDAMPLDMEPRIHKVLMEAAWPADRLELVTPPAAGDLATTWILVSLQTPPGGELALERLELDEILPATVERRLVGAQTRPALPVAAGRTFTFDLPRLTEGTRIELALAPPDGLVRTTVPIRARCELATPRPQVQTVTFADGADGPLVRRWNEVAFTTRSATGANEPAPKLVVTVEGPESRALFVTPPRVLPRRDAATGPNVILVSLDTLRADRVGAFGSKSGATPNLDRFAQRCVRFTNARSPANFTVPAHASMMTGLQPRVHGAWRYEERVSIRPWPNLAGACAKAGMVPVAFTGGGFVDAAFGFDQEFASYAMLDPLMTRSNPRFAASPRKEDPDYNRALRTDVSLAGVTGFLDRHADRRFFLFLHTYHTHDYAPSDASARRFGVDLDAGFSRPFDLDPRLFPTITPGSAQLDYYSRTYDAALSETDAAFGELVAALERDGLLASTIVVVTADHGEGFQEHGVLFHANGLHDEVLHVPLLLYVPGADAAAPRTIDAPVSLIDVAPTLLDLLGLPPLPDVQGVSLAPLLRGEELAPRLLLAQDAPATGETSSAVIQSRFKYLQLMKGTARSERLYDVVADPLERRDLAADPAFEQELLRARAAMERVLADVDAAAQKFQARRDQLVTSPDLADELKKLGY